jgi:hypothetical protein
MPIRSAAPTNRNPSPVRKFTDTSRHAACPSRQRKVDRKGVAAWRLPGLRLSGGQCTRRPDVLQRSAKSPVSDCPDSAADDLSVQDLLSGLVTVTGNLRFTIPSRSHCQQEHSNTNIVSRATSRTNIGLVSQLQILAVQPRAALRLTVRETSIPPLLLQHERRNSKLAGSDEGSGQVREAH